MTKLIKIYPKCKLKEGTVLSVKYDGYVVPCCHYGSGAFKQIRMLLGDKVKQLHISNGTLDEINRSEAMKIIEDSIYSENPMPKCIETCQRNDTLTTDYTENNSFIKNKKI